MLESLFFWKTSFSLDLYLDLLYLWSHTFPFLAKLLCKVVHVTLSISSLSFHSTLLHWDFSLHNSAETAQIKTITDLRIGKSLGLCSSRDLTSLPLRELTFPFFSKPFPGFHNKTHSCSSVWLIIPTHSPLSSHLWCAWTLCPWPCWALLCSLPLPSPLAHLLPFAHSPWVISPLHFMAPPITRTFNSQINMSSLTALLNSSPGSSLAVMPQRHRKTWLIQNSGPRGQRKYYRNSKREGRTRGRVMGRGNKLSMNFYVSPTVLLLCQGCSPPHPHFSTLEP